MKACNDKYLTKGLGILNNFVILSKTLSPSMLAFIAHRLENICKNLTLKHIKYAITTNLKTYIQTTLL